MFRISKRKAEKKRVLLGGRCPWLHLPHLPFESNKNNKNIRYIPDTARSSGFLSQLLVVGGEEVFLLVKLHPHSRPDCRGGRGPKLLLPHPCLSPCHCRRPLHSIGISSIINKSPTDSPVHHYVPTLLVSAVLLFLYLLLLLLLSTTCT